MKTKLMLFVCCIAFVVGCTKDNVKIGLSAENINKLFEYYE